MIEKFEKQISEHVGWIGLDINEFELLGIKLYNKNGSKEISKSIYPNIIENRSELFYLNYIIDTLNPFNNKNFNLYNFITKCGNAGLYKNIELIYKIFINTLNTKKNPLNIIGNGCSDIDDAITLKVYYTFAIFKKIEDKFCEYNNVLSKEVIHTIGEIFPSMFSNSFIELIENISENSIINGIGINVDDDIFEAKVYMNCYNETDKVNLKLFDSYLYEYKSISVDLIKFMNKYNYDFNLIALSNSKDIVRLYFKK